MTNSFGFGFADWGKRSRGVLDEAVDVASVYVSCWHLVTPGFDLAV